MEGIVVGDRFGERCVFEYLFIREEEYSDKGRSNQVL
jgi:hypothetical protein